MALLTLGTTDQTSLTAIDWKLNGASLSQDDIYTIAESILNDEAPGNPIFPGAFGNNNLLFVPNRGVLKVLKGDVVAVDSTGWPILVSKLGISGSSWAIS